MIVSIRQEKVTIPTYLPDDPQTFPLFLEKRVYQGSSGKVYPLPTTDRISELKVDHTWNAVFIENEYLEVMILPEIGGRIHAIYDKTNDYDLIYRQSVIKPALVGLAGSWISGGIEFNWAQHHRPGTFLPSDFAIEESADGSKTVWLGDHEPMSRMKSRHGICLHPDRAIVELKVFVSNRTPLRQTFLWWANVATKVHEGYQSFFPPDVSYVADHAKRAMSEFPLCHGEYYGVNYAARAKTGVPQNEIPSRFVPPHCHQKSDNTLNFVPNDLSWYANIPVPTSYMCMGSKEDFFGGYDHFADAGLVHIADHHISPGKKQWTWGNHEFGYAWDRLLSDDEEPYIELMSGVFTDNQPDFSFLAPYETKSWSQYWYPIAKIGVPQMANINAAISLELANDRLKIGVCPTREFRNAKICVEIGSLKSREYHWIQDISPRKPVLKYISIDQNAFCDDVIQVRVFDQSKHEIIAYHKQNKAPEPIPEAAVEPDSPESIPTIEELYLTGLHLDQYRHATRNAVDYWREALRRDPLDSRSNNALGLFYLKRGEFLDAEKCFLKAISRLTNLNPNPENGECYYNLGLSLRYQLDDCEDSTADDLFERAYAAFYKATWNEAQCHNAFYALAELDCRVKDWQKATYHCGKSIVNNSLNSSAKCLHSLVLRNLGKHLEADSLIAENIRFDPLDVWSIFLQTGATDCDAQTLLDISFDFVGAGFYSEAIALIESRIETFDYSASLNLGTKPLLRYTLGWLFLKRGDRQKAEHIFAQAAAEPGEYCFPNRLQEIAVLMCAMSVNPRDAASRYYLGNFLYDRQRYAEAIKLWEESTRLNAAFATVWRNLGIAYFNFENEPQKAFAAYENAFRLDSKNPRLIFERDQLWKRIGISSAERLAELEENNWDLMVKRDDLVVELLTIYNELGRPQDALQILETRKFQPWEGGEGQVLAQFVRSNILIGTQELDQSEFAAAAKYFERCLHPPKNLAETHHLLANRSEIYYYLGLAEFGSRVAPGNIEKAHKYWGLAASSNGDFQQMSVTQYSEMTLFSALSLTKLGRDVDAKVLLHELLQFAETLEDSVAKIDYFATSLPTMLLFANDIQKRQETRALFLQAQARFGLGELEIAKTLLQNVLENDPNHQLALTFRYKHYDP